MTEKHETRYLPVKLDEVTERIRAKELAAAEKRLCDAEEELTEFVKASKVEKATIEGRISVERSEVRRLGKIVRDGREDAEVGVYESADYERGVMVLRRADTNEELEMRAMTEAERQRSLFTVADAGAPETAA